MLRNISEKGIEQMLVRFIAMVGFLVPTFSILVILIMGILGKGKEKLKKHFFLSILCIFGAIAFAVLFAAEELSLGERLLSLAVGWIIFATIAMIFYFNKNKKYFSILFGVLSGGNMMAILGSILDGIKEGALLLYPLIFIITICFIMILLLVKKDKQVYTFFKILIGTVLAQVIALIFALKNEPMMLLLMLFYIFISMGSCIFVFYIVIKKRFREVNDMKEDV